MRITKRDIELIRWINGFGYVRVQTIALYLRIDFSTAARRIRILIEAGLLKKLNTIGPPVILPTKRGLEVANDYLLPLNNIAIGALRHSLLIAECALALERRFQGIFEPERRILDRYRQEREGHVTHLPDGLLHLSDKQALAIELELSAKSVTRTKDILLTLSANQEISETWFIVIDSKIKHHIIQCSEGFENVSTRLWKPKHTYL